MHDLEELLIAQLLRDLKEDLEIITGNDIEGDNVRLVKYFFGFLFEDWEACLVDLRLER